MTPRRRQGSGRAAIDHIKTGLTDALSTLSKVTASQTAIAEVARGDLGRGAALLARLDDDLLAAVRGAACQLYDLARDEQSIRIDAGGKSP